MEYSPGQFCSLVREDEIVYEQAFGSRSLVPTKSLMQTTTIFDLASLTKPLATTVAFMLLIGEKKVQP